MKIPKVLLKGIYASIVYLRKVGGGAISFERADIAGWKRIKGVPRTVLLDHMFVNVTAQIFKNLNFRAKLSFLC